MPRPSPHFGPPPLAVQLAKERFRQQAMAGVLDGMSIDPEAVSHDVGGELWLILTQSAWNRIEEDGTPGLSEEEWIESVRGDLHRACELVLERDRQGNGLTLKVQSANWCLIVKPGDPAWVVVAIFPQQRPLRYPLVALPWRVIRVVDDGEEQPTPLPLWLLAQAQLRDRELRLDARRLRNPERPADERAEAGKVRMMQEELPEAMQDLSAAFRLLQWERERRPRLSWMVTLTPLGEAAATKGRRSYVVEGARINDWPQRPLRLALGVEPRARWVDVAPDPESSSRWLLHGPESLEGETTLFELAEFEYRRQSMIAARLANPSKIRLEDAALAATQILVPTTITDPPKLQSLPGEAPWEERQEEALRLALAGHPVCAIKGPPGTGKSTVIVGLIRRAVQAGQRVLLVAPTHVALDEVLGRVHELREKDLEQNIVPARVAPADERRAQVKPELEEYIARHLGRNLARKSLKHIRGQLGALPAVVVLEETFRRCGVAAAQLRVLNACRQSHGQACDALTAARAARQAAKLVVEQSDAALREVRSVGEKARQCAGELDEAVRQFAPLEAQFFGTRHGLSANVHHRGEQQAAVDRAREVLEAAQKRVEEGESTLAAAQALLERRRPKGTFTRLAERVFSSYSRAVKEVQGAEARLVDARRDHDAARQSLPTAEANLGAAEWALAEARRSVDEVEREVRARLAPAEAALALALDGEYANWWPAMPDSLHRAVATIAGRVQWATQAHADTERSLDEAVQAERSADGVRGSAEKVVEIEQAKLAALGHELHEGGIPVSDDLPRHISEWEGKQAATAREMELVTRRRGLLQRWLEFYEHEDGDEQITAWAMNSVNLVAATTQGIAGSREFAEHDFDLVICDESSRVTRGEILVPADRAARIVLVGDEKQLPPYVESDDEQFLQALAVIHLSESRPEALPEMAARLCESWNVDEPEFRPVRAKEVGDRARVMLAQGHLPAWPGSAVEAASTEDRLRAWRRVADALTGSCFDHLLGILPAERVVRLSVQRRMVPEMARLVSEPVYGGDYQSPEASPIAPLLTPAFRHPWVVLNTRSYGVARPEFRERHEGTGFVNEGEARAVVLALRQHVAAAERTGQEVSLMVITFYLAQARLIESHVRRDKGLQRRRIAILPIDRCQGQEADAVVVSFVRTLQRPRPDAGRWLQDVRRLNVALTRARHSLVLIGNLQTLTALRGDPEGEKLLAHLGQCVAEQPDHQIEQLHGL